MKNILIEFKNNICKYKVTFIIIFLWIIMFILDKVFNLMPLLCGKGFNYINNEYYRIGTAWLLHINLFHLIVNILGIYWVGYFLENKIGSIKFLLICIFGSIIEETIYSGLIFRNSTDSFGGSICVFVLIGVIFILELMNKEMERFKLRTWYGNWILGYVVLGNLPIYSFFSIGTVILHSISFVIGIIMGFLLYILV